MPPALVYTFPAQLYALFKDFRSLGLNPDWLPIDIVFTEELRGTTVILVPSTADLNIVKFNSVDDLYNQDSLIFFFWFPSVYKIGTNSILYWFIKLYVKSSLFLFLHLWSVHRRNLPFPMITIVCETISWIFY